VTFLIVMVAIFAVAAPGFASSTNALNVATASSVTGIVSLGQAFAIIGGGFDLSVSGVVALGSVTFALASNAGFALPVVIVITLAMGCVVGAINGLIVTRLKINPLIATLGTLSITTGLAYTLVGGVQVPLNDTRAAVLSSQAIPGISNVIFILAALSLLAWFVLSRTVFGRTVYAIGGNSEAARLAGIRVDAVTVGLYVICSACSALAGLLLGGQLLMGTGVAGTNANLASITAVILGGAALTGGVGGIGGTLVGVLIVGVLINGMALLQIPPYLQQMTTGAVLLLAVGFSQLRARLEERR
jgi:ribose transport system permease protein